jgi:hypothetical protein
MNEGDNKLPSLVVSERQPLFFPKSAVSTPLPTIGLQRTSYARPLAARELGGTALVRGVASSHTTRPAATHCLLRPV